MAYEVPERRKAEIREVVEALRSARHCVLTTHINADGDGTGSEVALTAWLRATGKEAWIVNPTTFPESFQFMVPDPSWIVDAGSGRARELCAQADLAVVLDTGEVPRIGRVKPLIDDAHTVVIDHHPTGDAPIAGTSFRDPTACATGELLYDVILEAGGPWPDAVLNGIYVAILTDTGSFRFSNSTPACHRVAAELIEKGVDPEEMHRQAYGASPLRRLKLLQASLDTLEVGPEGKVAWMLIPPDAFERLGATTQDLEGMVDYPRSVEGVEVGILFRRTSRGDTKISFRSTGEVDVNALARKYGGGGHVKASGALVEGPPVRVMPKVVDATIEAVQRSGHGGRS